MEKQLILLCCCLFQSVPSSRLSCDSESILAFVISGVFRMCERRGPGGLADEVHQKLTLFVTECLNFDVLEEKISKTAKNTIIKIMVG